MKPTTILTDAEVGEVARGIRAFFGEKFAALAASCGLELKEGVRFMAVAGRCEERRAARGWTVKEVAKELKVPQYRLKDIEAGHIRSVKPEILGAYVSHLGLHGWYRRWKRGSPDVARRLKAEDRAAEPAPFSWTG